MTKNSLEGRNRGQFYFRFAMLAVAALMAWPVLGVTTSMVLASRAPDTVLAIWPVSAAAKIAKVSAGLELRRSENAEASQRLALDALMREPVNVEAARSLGIARAMGGQATQERRLMLYAHTLSRRDLLTELWMIEESSRRGELDRTLAHYDHALRTRSSSWALLLPVLVEATRDPLVRDRAENRARSRPPYWGALADYMIELGPDPASLERIIGALELDPQVDEERARLERATDKLIARSASRSAFRLYQQARKVASGKAAPLRDGGFESTDALTAFEWRLVDQSDLGAVRETREGAQGTALSLIAGGGRGGEVARQLLLLSPGTYRLSFRAGETPAAVANRPRLVVACAQGGRELLRYTVPQAPASGSLVATSFTVPLDCDAQWLAVVLSPSSEAAANSPWLDQMSLVGGGA